MISVLLVGGSPDLRTIFATLLEPVEPRVLLDALGGIGAPEDQQNSA